MTSYEQYPDRNPACLTISTDFGQVPNLRDYPDGYPDGLLGGLEAADTIDAYAAAGRRLSDPDIPAGESFVADRAMFDASYGAGTTWGVVRDRLDPAAVDSRTRAVGQYDVNNQKLSFVNERGELVVARYATSTVQSLQAAGYRKGSVQVPFSNADKPIPDSTAALHLQLFAALNKQDELAAGATTHLIDVLDPSGLNNPARLATRGTVVIESVATSDRRVTEQMDPDQPDALKHTIQTLRDRIAFLELDELHGE